jgi:hypothetical protein
VNQSQGGIGSMWEFRPDGTLTMAPGAVVNMPYQISGERLILPPETTHADAKPQTYSFRIEGNTLYEVPAEFAPDQLEKGMKFTRVSKPKPGDQPIVGTWKLAVKENAAQSAASEPASGRQEQGREIILRNTWHTYTRDGVLKLRIPFTNIAGTYNVADGKSGTFSMGATPSQIFTYRLADGKLYLTQPDGKTEDVYVREDNE